MYDDNNKTPSRERYISAEMAKQEKFIAELTEVMNQLLEGAHSVLRPEKDLPKNIIADKDGQELPPLAIALSNNNRKILEVADGLRSILARLEI